MLKNFLIFPSNVIVLVSKFLKHIKHANRLNTVTCSFFSDNSLSWSKMHSKNFCPWSMKESVSKLTYPTFLHCLRMLYTQMAIPSISDGQSDRKPISSELHKFKRDINWSLKKIKSAFSVKMHIYRFCPS